MSYATYGIIRNETLIEKDIWRFLSIVFDLERTNQLSLLPHKDLVHLCHPIEPYQVTKNPFKDDLVLVSLAKWVGGIKYKMNVGWVEA